MHISKLIFAICVSLATPITLNAASWRGLVPFHSNRNDVERKLGKPIRSDDQWLIYELANEDVSFRIADGEACVTSVGLTTGTIIYIEVMPRKALHLSEVGLRPGDIRRFEPGLDPMLPYEGYVDEQNGLAARLESNKAHAVVYFLGNAKERERCPVFYPVARVLLDVPMCFLCPAFYLSSPEDVEEGTPVTFTALGATWSRPTTINWEITAGKILSGQGTNSIRVDSTKLEGKLIKATFNIMGLDRACPNQASITMNVTKRRD